MSVRLPYWSCMLSAKDKLEISYRSLKFGHLLKIIIQFRTITSRKKKVVWYFSSCCLLVHLPSALPPPRVHIFIYPPTPSPHWHSSPFRDSNASNPQPQVQSRSPFFSSLYAVISLPHQGNKSFVPFSNLSDVDSLTKTWKVLHQPVFDSRPSPSLITTLRIRFVPRSPASSNKVKGSRTLAGGFGIYRILWLIPTTPALSESSRGSPSTWVTNSTRRKEGTYSASAPALPFADLHLNAGASLNSKLPDSKGIIPPI